MYTKLRTREYTLIFRDFRARNPYYCITMLIQRDRSDTCFQTHRLDRSKERYANLTMLKNTWFFLEFTRQKFELKQYICDTIFGKVYTICSFYRCVSIRFFQFIRTCWCLNCEWSNIIDTQTTLNNSNVHNVNRPEGGQHVNFVDFTDFLTQHSCM